MITMYVIHFVDSPFTNLPSLPKFKELNQEVLEFERRVHNGTHTLMDDSSAYERPPVGLERTSGGVRDLCPRLTNQSKNAVAEYLKRP